MTSTNTGTANLPDRDISGRTSQLSQTTNDHPDHLCKVCGRYACFGYGVKLLKGEEGVWYCGAHRPLVPEPVVISEPVRAALPVREGRLL